MKVDYYRNRINEQYRSFRRLLPTLAQNSGKNLSHQDSKLGEDTPWNKGGKSGRLAELSKRTVMVRDDIYGVGTHQLLFFFPLGGGRRG